MSLRFLLVWLILTGVLPGLRVTVFAQRTAAEYTFIEGGKDRVTTRIFVEDGRIYTAWEILSAAGQARSHFPDKASVSEGAYVWQRLDLVNGENTPQQQIFHLNPNADSIWVYSIYPSGKLDKHVTWFEGERSSPAHRFLPDHTISVSLGPNERKTLLWRQYLGHSRTEAAVASVAMADGRWLIDRNYGLMAWHSFYAGLMIAIAILSLLNYRLFRNVAFVYFSLVNLSFAAYFLENNHLLQFIGVPRINGNFTVIATCISSSVIWLTFFGLSYAEVKTRFPRYFYAIVLTTVLVVAAQFIPGQLGMHPVIRTQVANFSLLVWIIVIIAPLASLAYRGDDLARRLLRASVLLTAPAAVLIVTLLFTNIAYNYLLVALELGTLGFSALLFISLFNDVSAIKDNAHAERQQNVVKSRFFANISHEFRTPLTLITGSIDQLLKRHDQYSEDGQLLQLARINATRQLGLVNRVLQLSRLEANQDVLTIEPIDLYILVFKVTESFRTIADQQDINLKFVSAPERTVVIADWARIEEVLFNLLSNALKFTPAGGKVAVSLATMEGEAIIKISDTGTGIRKDLLPNVFDRFFQSEEGRGQGRRGSGIGLSLVREIVNLHGGRAYAESEPHRGSTFTVILPSSRIDHLSVRQVAGPGLNMVDDRNATLPSLDSAASTAEGPTILIVEDNEELRAFIRYSLQRKFIVVEARDGAEGIRLAVKLQPDLIISDVMMPHRDGYELCAAVKSNIETSHIPIILLTAKASAKSRIIGLNHGADDYLTKPFNDEELSARVHNLIELRRVLRQRYAASIELKPSEIATNDVDADFLQTAMDLLERHLADETFRVADFAHELGMSSASLNRKFRALLDQSTNQFMLSVRLQRASDLINSKEYNVAEVAHRTGFSSSAYFVKLFKEKYGHTPGTILKNEEG